MVPLSSTAVHESCEQTLKDRESVDDGHVDLSDEFHEHRIVVVGVWGCFPQGQSYAQPW